MNILKNFVQNDFSANRIPLISYKASDTVKYINTTPNDEFCFKEMYMSRDENAELEKRGIQTGKINNSNYILKFSSNDNEQTDYMEGEIDNKKFSIKHSFNEDKKSDKNIRLSLNIKGTYDNKDIDLNFELGKDKSYKNKTPKFVNITGTYNNESVDIQIPGAKIPENEDIKNITTLLLDSCGLQAQTYQGNIIDIIRTYKAEESNLSASVKKEEKIDNHVQNIIGQTLSIITTSLLTAVLCKFGIHR